MFAISYLQKQDRNALFEKAAVPGLKLIVVIPCLKEPDILKTIQSLDECDVPNGKIEVIVLINHSEIAEAEIKTFNQQTKAELDSWISHHKKSSFEFLVCNPVDLPKKWAGAGVARKYGMDEATRRFNTLDKPDGIIVSLDADTLVDKNYLVEIEHYFLNNPQHVGCTITFEHQKTGFPENLVSGITLYEQYLHYYRDAVEYTGYPWSIYTIGSAFAVTADAYVKRGGMTRRKAGEDFYFLQNLVQIGIVGELKTTKVYPSPRESGRVPFGTGASMKKWISGEEDLNKTFNIEAFTDLKSFFGQIESLYKTDEINYLKILSKMSEPVRQFLLAENFWNDLDELNKNCSSLKSFSTRFFHKFNAFKILQFLNFTHENFFEKADLTEQILKLNKIKNQ